MKQTLQLCACLHYMVKLASSTEGSKADCPSTCVALNCSKAIHTKELQVGVTYDWRLAVPLLEQRDGYFSKLKGAIESAHKLHKQKVQAACCMFMRRAQVGHASISMLIHHVFEMHEHLTLILNLSCSCSQDYGSTDMCSRIERNRRCLTRLLLRACGC